LVVEHCVRFDDNFQARQILGINNFDVMKFVGRGGQVRDIIRNIRFNLNSSSRFSTIFVNGCAGVGKSRALIEVCQDPNLKDVVKFVVTFNNQTGITDLDEFLFSDSLTSPAVLSLRLLYSYARRADMISFEVWCDQLENYFKHCAISTEFLQYLDPIRVVYWIVRQIHINSQAPTNVLVVVDECLMAWNKSQIDSKSIEFNTWAMLRSLYSHQGNEHCFSVLFSALNDRPFLKNKEPSPTESTIEHIELESLTIEDAKYLLKQCFDGSVLLKRFHMTVESFVSRIVQFCGTMPRALECFIATANSISGVQIFDFRDLVLNVSHQIAQKYPLPDDLTDRCLAEALLGIPMEYGVAFDLLKRGIVCEAVPNSKARRRVRKARNPSPIQVKLDMIQVIAYSLNLIKSDRIDQLADDETLLFNSVLIDALQAISQAFSAHNPFEEIYRYRLFLELHYRHLFCRDQQLDMIQFFSPSVTSFKVKDVQLKIDNSCPVCPRQISCWNPIGANSIRAAADKSHCLTVPKNYYEPGVDTIAYLRVPGLRSKPSKIFGLQLKFRFAVDRDVVMDSIKSDAHSFFCRMTHLGHNIEDIVFVAVLHQSLPNYMFKSDPRRESFFCGLMGKVILICDNGQNFQTHLGPTLFSLASRYYDLSRSDNYDPVTIAFPGHDDRSALFAENEFKLYQSQLQVRMDASVLALELENTGSFPFQTIQLLKNWQNELANGCESALRAFEILGNHDLVAKVHKKLGIALKRML
jgi:hypothetical protein